MDNQSEHTETIEASKLSFNGNRWLKATQPGMAVLAVFFIIFGILGLSDWYSELPSLLKARDLYTSPVLLPFIIPCLCFAIGFALSKVSMSISKYRKENDGYYLDRAIKGIHYFWIFLSLYMLLSLTLFIVSAANGSGEIY